MPCVFPLCVPRQVRGIFIDSNVIARLNAPMQRSVSADYTYLTQSSITPRRGTMSTQTAIEQFYAQLREASFVNKVTASDISAKKGVHYTYVYNTVRKNANVTLKTAEELADAAGYRLVMHFEPKGGSSELVGNMDPQGALFSERRPRGSAKTAAAPMPPVTVTDKDPTTVSPQDGHVDPTPSPQNELDAEIAALLEGDL